MNYTEYKIPVCRTEQLKYLHIFQCGYVTLADLRHDIISSILCPEHSDIGLRVCPEVVFSSPLCSLRQVNVPALQKIMVEFARENERSNLTGELIGDTLDDALTDEGSAEAEDKIVSQVRINILVLLF